ncbi:MAG: FxsA family protein [Gemmatimonadota bacterium]|jgi:UPF0716 protein FxsA
MWLRLLLAFTLVPVLELWLLLRIGAWLGPIPTIALVLLTGAAGATLARREGAHAWSAVQSEAAAGRMPGRELLEAMLVLVAGIVLVTPGVLTDALGLLLLVRPIRARLVRRLEERYRARLGAPPGRSPEDSAEIRGRVIEL